MDCVRAGLARGADVLGRIEVGGDFQRLARAARVQLAGVVGCDDRDRGDAFLRAGSEDPQGDLAPVRYEQFLHDREP